MRRWAIASVLAEAFLMGIIGTVIGVLFQQAVPVFADLEPFTYAVSARTIEPLITPKTKAIIAVHLGGNPSQLAELKALEEQIAVLESQEPALRDEALLASLKAELERISQRRKWVAYIDPVDVRFNAFVEQPQPSSQAVMFCLMDVSGSMGEREKDLAKRFFVLLHLFLRRRYDKVDIVFIRHTHDAQEVDEQTFFYSRQSGGTIVSTALEKMLEIQRQRYTTADWNIYSAQASDGYTQSGDAKRCVELLENELMPICQYYAYIEILDEREMEVFSSEEAGAELWRAYRTVAERWKNFATKRIAKPSDIFPVFHELFKKQEAA